MIKILIINTVRFKLNGISAVIKNYYQAMDRSGMVIDFLAIDTPCAEYQDFSGKIAVHAIYKKSNLFRYFCGIIQLCKKERYDIVHVHGNSANMAIELQTMKSMNRKYNIPKRAISESK